MSDSRKDEMQEIASRHLSKYREKSHAELQEWVEHGHIETFEVKGTGPSRYQVEVNFNWDDERGGDIRVDATIDEDPHRPLFGFLPAYISTTGAGFIMSPDGSFIDE